MKKLFILFSLSGISIWNCSAQHFPNYSIIVKDVNDISLKLPWSGGLNNPQFSNVDLNNDGVEDLFIFDRTGNKVLTFINHGTPGIVDYTYAPEYEAGFPFLKHWALLKDYNCDGIADIWTYTDGPILDPQAGIQVYRGYYSIDNEIQFVSVDSIVEFPWQGFDVNLYVSKVDIPAIADVNGDGDVDVLTFQITGGYVEYYENLSKEAGFGCDSLLFKKLEDCWGDFYESGFRLEDSLNIDCPSMAPEDNDDRSGERHSGSCELAWDNTGDGSVEFLKGDISFTHLVYMINGGTPSDAHMISEDTLFPPYNIPADVIFFPAPFLADVNNDGLKDLLVAPNDANGSENYFCSWFYKNAGNAVTASFNHESSSFLVSDMIDEGEGSYPVFFRCRS